MRLLDESHSLSMAAMSGLSDNVTEAVFRLLASDELPPPPHYRRCIESEQTVVVEHPGDDPDWPVLEGVEPAALFAEMHPDAPFFVTLIRCEGDIVGILAGHLTTHGRKFDRRDVSRVETFATMVGLALANVRFYATLNAKVEERTRSLRDAQAALVQSEKMAALGQLVAGVAHEINTPIGAVVSGAGVANKALEMVRKGLEDPAKNERKIQRALTILSDCNDTNRIAGERITERVTSLRNFARLDEADRKQADLHEGLDNTLMLVRAELRDIELVKHYGELPLIDCYPNQLNQVFLNVLVNAIHAIDGAGTITIATSMENDAAIVRISDTGGGIAAEDVAKVFDPGFTRKGVGVGTGLGLSICYQIMNHHKGGIEVDSEVGVGTTFTLRVPHA
jgi:signal transduction histidine kinase